MADASQNGMQFAGWYLDAGFQERFDGLSGSIGNLTLYAKFVNFEYKKLIYLLPDGTALICHRQHSRKSTLLHSLAYFGIDSRCAAYVSDRHPIWLCYVIEINIFYIKDIMRSICDDRMSDIQKTRAIFDWLVVNIYYDNAVLRYAVRLFWLSL